MYTLGINAAFHDCGACLVKDGIVAVATEGEHFMRIKRGKHPLPARPLPGHRRKQAAGVSESDACDEVGLAAAAGIGAGGNHRAATAGNFLTLKGIRI